MSRVPFWLVVVFAVILCVTGGLTLLHRTGLFSISNTTTSAKNQPLPPETGLIVTGVERRNPGVLIIEGRAQPQAAILLKQGDKQLEATNADSSGNFTIPFRLIIRDSLQLSLQAEGKSPLWLLIADRPQLLVFINQTYRYVPLNTDDLPYGILVVHDLDPPPQQDIIGHAPAGATIQLYAGNLLIAKTTAGQGMPRTDLFTFALNNNLSNGAHYRVDILGNDGLPIARSHLDLSSKTAWQGITPEDGDGSVYIWRTIKAQQADPGAILPGQIIPVAAKPYGKAD